MPNPVIDAQDAIIRFNNDGWLTLHNLGWGIFRITGASENMARYRDWQYYETMELKIKAALPHIDLFDGRRFWYLARVEVVGIESLDESWH